MPPDRAEVAAEALCHGDLTGMSTHGLVNLTRRYLPLFDSGRTRPAADTVVLGRGRCRRCRGTTTSG